MEKQQETPSKIGFSDQYKKHKSIMESNGCNIDEMIQIRQQIHSHPEGGFKETETQKTIKQALIKFGIEESSIKICAQTGFVVDIKGTGAQNEDHLKKPKAIALRTDIDALLMPENNPNLPYKSKTSFAHMCGHDGHVATLLLAASILAKSRSKIPKDKFVRLLFQPAEEGPGGALPMIKEGCLNDIDEVYGLHNVPNFAEGEIRACVGPIMAQRSIVKITIKGQGGHGSSPHNVRDPICCANQIYNAFHTIKSRNINNKDNIVFTICHIESGHTYNVFPDSAFMEGSIRSYDQTVCNLMKKRIKDIAENTAKAYDCEVEVQCIDEYPPTINHKEQTLHVNRLAKKWFGEEYVNQDDLPVPGSEDFSYFIQEKPGCFFFLGTMKPDEVRNPKTLHMSNYDFNDNLLATGGYFWIRIIEDRLGCQIINQ